MNADHPPARSRARRAAAWLWLLVPLWTSGCSALANEFSWYDRAGPVAAAAPDAAQNGLISRP